MPMRCRPIRTSACWPLNVNSKREAFLDKLKTPSWKQRLLIITHIRSKSVFFDNGLHVFEWQSVGNYHKDMNIFSIWKMVIQWLSVITCLQQSTNTKFAWGKENILKWFNEKYTLYAWQYGCVLIPFCEIFFWNIWLTICRAMWF